MLTEHQTGIAIEKAAQDVAARIRRNIPPEDWDRLTQSVMETILVDPAPGLLDKKFVARIHARVRAILRTSPPGT